MGKLVVFEGPDGVGKSTVSRAVANARGAHWTAEPTKDPVGLRAREAMLRSLVAAESEDAALLRAEAFGLFTLDRTIHNQAIREQLLTRDVVVDRYALSTWVYQTSHMPLDLPDALRLAFSAALTPDLTVILLASDATLAARIAARGGADAADAVASRSAILYRNFAAGLHPKRLDRFEPFFRSPLAPGNYLRISAEEPVDAIVDAVLTALSIFPTPLS
jgi:thymidylate kinase